MSGPACRRRRLAVALGIDAPMEWRGRSWVMLKAHQESLSATEGPPGVWSIAHTTAKGGVWGSTVTPVAALSMEDAVLRAVGRLAWRV